MLHGSCYVAQAVSLLCKVQGLATALRHCCGRALFIGSPRNMTTAWNDRANELAMECLAQGTSSAWARLCSYGLRMGFFQKVTAHCSQIVCAVTNRDGYGCNVKDVHENIEDTVHAGWCDKFFDGIFTDIEQSEREAVLLFNEKMVGSTKGFLAPIERDLVKFQTLAGSHTNQGHRQLCTNKPYRVRYVCFPGVGSNFGSSLGYVYTAAWLGLSSRRFHMITRT